MGWTKRWRRRIRALTQRSEVESELDEELAFHLEMETEKNVRAGMRMPEARRRAALAFGAAERHREETRDARWLGRVVALSPDVKLALRMLIKHRALTVVGGFGMAVAIAIAVGFFTFMTFYYSSPPLDEGDRIMALEYTNVLNSDFGIATALDYHTWREELRSVRDVAAFRRTDRALSGTDGAAGPVRVAEMTASGFRLARVAPLLGRPLLEEDEAEGAPPVVVIGYDEWRRDFGGDPGVIGVAVRSGGALPTDADRTPEGSVALAGVGREIRLNGTPHTIVGVMPEGFRFPVDDGYWTPLRIGRSVEGMPAVPRLTIFGRLAPGVERDAALAEMVAIASRHAEADPDTYRTLRPRINPFIHQILDVHQYPPWSIWLMQVFAGLLLALVAMNVAVLVYARTAARNAELTVRAALGAGRFRIVGQLFLEALALSSIAAVGGLLTAQLGFGMLMGIADLSGALPYWISGRLPAATALYAAGLAFLAAFIVGVLPALRATGGHLQTTLRKMGGATGLRMGRTWTILIVVQVAIGVAVLPAVVGLAWNTLFVPRATPLFAAEEMVTLRMAPQAAAGEPAPSGDAFADVQAELFRRLEAEPGVSSVTFASSPPHTGPRGRIEIQDVPGTVNPVWSRVDLQYFEVFDIPLLAGRPFESADLDGMARTVIVNRAFADRYLEGGQALGRRIRRVEAAAYAAEEEPWYEIVGIVENMLERSGRSDLVEPVVYRPMMLGAEPVSLVARSRGGDGVEVAQRLRELATEAAPDHIVSVIPMSRIYEPIDRDGAGFLLLVVGLVTGSVLLLSAAGISALMSFSVTRRHHEIGVRIALGAPRRKVMAAIFSRSVRQLTLGLMTGALIAGGLDRLLGGALLGGNVAVLLPLVGAMMLAAGLLATIGPARRALRIQPMEALRQE